MNLRQAVQSVASPGTSKGAVEDSVAGNVHYGPQTAFGYHGANSSYRGEANPGHAGMAGHMGGRSFGGGSTAVLDSTVVAEATAAEVCHPHVNRRTPNGALNAPRTLFAGVFSLRLAILGELLCGCARVPFAGRDSS